MSKLRLGRHNKQLVYVQTGREPSDSDRLFGVFFTEQDAAKVVKWADFLFGDLDEASTEEEQ